MTDQEQDAFNQQLRAKSILAEHQEVRNLQRQSAKEGQPLSSREAKSLIKERKEQEIAESNRIHEAVRKAEPEWLKNKNKTADGIQPQKQPTGIVHPPIPPQPAPNNSLVIPRRDILTTGDPIQVVVSGCLNGVPASGTALYSVAPAPI